MINSSSDAFQQGFVTGKYLCGVRQDPEELTAGLPAPTERARSLAGGLCHESRTARAQVLAAQSARLIQGLLARRLR